MPSGTPCTHGGHGRPPPLVPRVRPRVLRAMPASRRIPDLIRPAPAAVRTTHHARRPRHGGQPPMTRASPWPAGRSALAGTEGGFRVRVMTAAPEARARAAADRRLAAERGSWRAPELYANWQSARCRLTVEATIHL